MAEKESPKLKLPYPTNAGETKKTGTYFEELALRLDTIISWGYVTKTGAIEAGTGDFTVAKLAAGEYEVVWTKERTSGFYAVNATVNGTSSAANVAFAVVATIVKAKIIVATLNAGTRTKEENNFMFIAMGN